MLEKNVLREVWLAVARTTILFRLNTGQAWVSGAEPARRLESGDVLVPAGRPIAMGFGMPNGKPLNGTSDLCGWTSVVVTPEMVGTKVAVFTAIETKKPKSDGRRAGVASSDQLNFVDQVTKAGGIAGIAHTAAVAQSIISDWLAARRARKTGETIIEK